MRLILGISRGASCALAASLFFAQVALADDNAASATANPPASPIAMTYFGVYQGPAVSQPLSAGSIDSSTAQYAAGEQSLVNQLKLDFGVGENGFIGPVINFALNPFMGQALYPYDSGVRIGHKQLVHGDDANLMADFRVMAPLRPSYRANDEVLNLQSLQIFTYKIPKSKVALGILGFHQFQIYGSGIPTRDPRDSHDPKDFSLYIAPNVTYQFTPTLAGIVSYEMYPWHKVAANWDNWSGDPSDIAPGVSWDISPQVNFTPALLLYPSNLSFKTLGTIAYLSAKIL